MSTSSQTLLGRRRGIGSKYIRLLDDTEVRNWYDNLLQGSSITAKKYLRRLGFICESEGTNPAEMVRCARQNDRWSYNFLIGLIRALSATGRAGSYIEDEKKVIVSWLRHNGLEVKGKVKVKGTEQTPTLTDRVPISQENLRALFACSPPQVRVIESLIAQSGLRPETVGDEEGGDGLMLQDIPEMQVDGNGSGVRVSFLKIPPMIIVRPELSKARHQYFTFLSDEGCEFVAEYLSLRAEAGEVLGRASPLVTPGRRGRKNEFVRTTLIGRLVKERLLRRGMNARPYDLRVMFDTQMLIAESQGLILRDYRVFFMGHRGDIEHRYTLNRHRLPESLVEELRKKYRTASRYLASTPAVSQARSIEDEVRTQMLLIAGFSEEEIGADGLLALPADEVTKRIRERIYSNATGEQLRQKVVGIEELDNYLAKGWTCVQALEGRNVAIVNPPRL